MWFIRYTSSNRVLALIEVKHTMVNTSFVDDKNIKHNIQYLYPKKIVKKMKQYGEQEEVKKIYKKLKKEA